MASITTDKYGASAIFKVPGGNDLNSILLKPDAITKANLNDVLSAGWIDKATLCQGVTAGAVTGCYSPGPSALDSRALHPESQPGAGRVTNGEGYWLQAEPRGLTIDTGYRDVQAAIPGATSAAVGALDPADTRPGSRASSRAPGRWKSDLGWPGNDPLR